MGVRMAGVVVADGDPIEFGPEILLHLEHEATGQRFEVLVFDRILRGDDETELMPVAVAAAEKGLSIAVIPLGIVKIARRSFPSDTVTLQVSEVRLCAIQPATGESYQPRFDNDSTTPECIVAVP
jgi:hypothetical protein